MGVVRKQGVQNTIIIYTGILIGFASLLFIQPYFLSTKELGLIRILLSFSSLLAAIFPLGSPNINVKYLPLFYEPKKKHHGFFGLMMFFPFVGIIIGCIALWLCKGWIIGIYSEKSPLFTNYFGSVAPLAIFITLIYTLNSYSNALFKTVFPSFLNDILNRVFLIAIILLYYFGCLNIDGFVLAFILIYALQALIMFVFVCIAGQPGFKPDLNYVNERVGLRFIIRYALILSFTSVSSVTLKFLDSLFLGIQNLESVGVYSVAAFIALIIETPLSSLERIANSKIAHYLAEKNYAAIKTIYYDSSRYLMLLGGFLMTMVIISISDLLSLLPPEYHGGANVTIIISVGSFINMATGINYPLLINSSKYIWGSVFLLILLITAIASNWLLIHVYGLGITGAAIATAFSSTLYNLLKYLFIWKNFQMQPFNFTSLKILITILIALGIGLIIPTYGSALVAIIYRSAGIALLFGGLTYSFRIIPEFHKYIPFIKHRT